MSLLLTFNLSLVDSQHVNVCWLKCPEPAITCLSLTMETLEQNVKYVQSQQ